MLASKALDKLSTLVFGVPERVNAPRRFRTSSLRCRGGSAPVPAAAPAAGRCAGRRGSNGTRRPQNLAYSTLPGLWAWRPSLARSHQRMAASPRSKVSASNGDKAHLAPSPPLPLTPSACRLWAQLRLRLQEEASTALSLCPSGHSSPGQRGSSFPPLRPSLHQDRRQGHRVGARLHVHGARRRRHAVGRKLAEKTHDMT